jgi:cysteine desulfurase / selenocysteine lyase
MPQDNQAIFDAALLSDIRDRFACVESDPFTGRRIFFENAGGALTLKSVIEAVAAHAALPDNAGRDNPTSMEIGRVMAQGREDLRTFLGATGGVVAMGESTTSLAFRAIGAVLSAVPGTNVVTTNLDHPSIYDATRVHAERCGREWRVAGLDPASGIVEPEAVLRCIDRNTCLLAVIHSSNNLGTKNDVRTMIQEARKVNPDLYVLVDGSQHVAHYPVDVSELGCDAYVFSSYKAFSKIGAAFIYLSDRLSLLPHDRLLGSAESNWELGTREQAGYAAWSEVVNYLLWLGSKFREGSDRRQTILAAMKAVEQYERTLTQRLLRGSTEVRGLLDMRHVTVYGETDDLAKREPVIAFSVHPFTAGELSAMLEEKRIRSAIRRADFYSRHTMDAIGIHECVRVSLNHYNTFGEIDTFLRAIDEAGL